MQRTRAASPRSPLTPTVRLRAAHHIAILSSSRSHKTRAESTSVKPATIRLGVLVTALPGLWLLALWFSPIRPVYYSPDRSPIRDLLLDPFRGPIALLSPALLVLAPLLFTRRETIARLLQIVLGILVFWAALLAFASYPIYSALAKAHSFVAQEAWRTKRAPVFEDLPYLHILLNSLGLLLVSLIASAVVWRISSLLRPPRDGAAVTGPSASSTPKA